MTEHFDTSALSERHRRRFLGTAAVGLAGVLAGCLGGDDGDDNGGDNGDTGNGDNGDNGNGGETEPANFAVNELDPAEAAVPVGAQITVGATVENTGEEEGTQEIALELDGESVESEDHTLASGDSEEVSFDLDTVDLDPGEYSYAITTEDDEESGTLTAEEPDPAFFEVTDLSPDGDTVEQGDGLTISATIENTGDEEATQDVELFIDDESADSEELTLDGNVDEIVFFDVGTDDLLGDYEYAITTEDDEASATFSVEYAMPGQGNQNNVPEDSTPESEENGLQSIAETYGQSFTVPTGFSQIEAYLANWHEEEDAEFTMTLYEGSPAEEGELTELDSERVEGFPDNEDYVFDFAADDSGTYYLEMSEPVLTSTWWWYETDDPDDEALADVGGQAFVDRQPVDEVDLPDDRGTGLEEVVAANFRFDVLR